MENLDKNLIGLILDRLQNEKEVNKCSRLNKHWHKTIKDYYYKNQFGVSLWKKHNPLRNKGIPCLKLSWHMVYILHKRYEALRNETKNLLCMCCEKVVNRKYLCEKCKNTICFLCIYRCPCCGTKVCFKCDAATFEDQCEDCRLEIA